LSTFLATKGAAVTSTISVGALRQNPTPMLREVQAGASYIVTDHGEPIAEIIPRPARRWVRAPEVDELLRELKAEDDWAREIAAARAAEPDADPWSPA